jgi:tetratricopeptide (TPR) repeat protein
MSFAWPLRLRVAGSPSFAIGLVALALAAATAQQAASAPAQQDQDDDRDIGWIQGLVTGPTGVPQHGGTVSLSTDGGATLRYNFTVSPKGDYTGRVPLGEYTLVYREPDTPEGKVVDIIHSVVILAGKGTTQDVDMTRQEYLDRLSPEQQGQLQQMKESNDKAAGTNKIITSINADMQTANRDFEDAANARATAIQTLGSTSSASEVDSTAYEIRVSKYTEIESLMSKATAELPDEARLWIDLGRAQVGLENYLDAETSFKKAVDLTAQAGSRSQQSSSPAPLVASINATTDNLDAQTANASPRGNNTDPQLAAAANAGLGEVYARTRMVDEAHASVAAAIKADPADAAAYLRNLAVIYFQEKNIWAQIDAADEAIKANPQDANLYFIKAEGLSVNAPADPDTNKLNLSPECVAAFREYLALAPTGEYAAQVTAILQNAAHENTGMGTAGPDPPARK